MFGQSLASGSCQDCHGGRVDEDDDWCVGVDFADGEVVGFAGSVQGEFAKLIW